MDNQVEEYIQKQRSPQREICKRLRKLILNTFPGINEAMKWGVPAYGDGLFYVVALKNHVNLGFSSRGLDKSEVALFDGGGKTTRHIEIASLKAIDDDRILQLLKLVWQHRA
jgi:hypothetical protein